jgi:spore maturation protein CgeB
VLPLINRVANWSSQPLCPVNPALKPVIKSPVYGLEMFQVLHDSHVVLNAHADSSPQYVSNMRLFETTGVGTCMLVDWKENLADLFDVDKEVVAYRSVGECLEKVQWLSEHPEEGAAIAIAGQKRTLAEHTFSHRAPHLNRLIKNLL